MNFILGPLRYIMNGLSRDNADAPKTTPTEKTPEQTYKELNAGRSVDPRLIEGPRPGAIPVSSYSHGMRL